jgi:HAD superfamily hydrolase (TIGR01458 family)
VTGFLTDIDGVVLSRGELVSGTSKAVAWLREHGHPFRFLTNTSRKPRRAVAQSLTKAGLDVDTREVISTSVVAVRWLRERDLLRIHFLVAEETLEDFQELEATESSPDAVVVGDMGRRWDFELLNRGFLSLHGGARLVALQKNRYWYSEEGLALDAGAFVAALEYAFGTKASVIGKPSKAYFEVARNELAIPPDDVYMIGDDVETDINGARDAGLGTILVRTGKYRGEALEREPDYQLDSIAELPVAMSTREEPSARAKREARRSREARSRAAFRSEPASGGLGRRPNCNRGGAPRH